MPRKRKPDQPTSDIETQVATESTTATIEPPVPESPEQSQGFTDPTGLPELQNTFAERILRERRRNIAADPFGIAGDYVAGVRLFENRKDRLMAIKFEEKPSSAVLGTMKDAGYRWNPRDMVWVHPIPPEAARTTRIEAERLYQEVRDMIRQEKGIESGQEIPF